MIEYCSKKLMMTTIGGLIVICVLVLYLEDTLIEHPAAVKADAIGGGGSSAVDPTLASQPQPSPSNNRSCRPVGDCIQCSQFESRMSNALLSPYCVSGYKQQLACPDGKPHFVQCAASSASLAATERGKFFLFHALCLLALLLSGTLAQRRQRQLNQNFADKITKQVASGV